MTILQDWAPPLPWRRSDAKRREYLSGVYVIVGHTRAQWWLYTVDERGKRTALGFGPTLMAAKLRAAIHARGAAKGCA